MILRYSILITLLLFLFCKKDNSRLPPRNAPLESVVRYFENDNILEGPRIGYGGMKSKQFEKYLEFKALASRDDLFLLTKHSSKLVRAIAFRALVSEPCPECVSIFLNAANDESELDIMDYDVINTCKFGDCLLRIWTQAGAILDDPSRRQLAAYLFTKTTKLRHKRFIFSDLYPDNDYYEDIKRTLKAEKEYSLLVPLAKYNKPDDFKLYLDLLTSFERPVQRDLLQAMKFYKHPLFLKQLVVISERAISQPDLLSHAEQESLFEAIASYHNAVSLSSITKSLEKCYTLSRKGFKENDLTHLYIGRIIQRVSEEWGQHISEEIGTEKALKIRDFFRRGSF